MFWLCLEGQSETAIALPRRAEAGNLYESLPEIPGSAMRGAFAGRDIHQYGPPKDSGEKIFLQWFENPEIRFGPLRPLPDDKLPCEFKVAPIFPVPRSASSCKYNDGFAEKHGVFDALLTQLEWDDKPSNNTESRKLRQCPECQAKLEPLDNTWLIAKWDSSLDNGSALDYDPVVQLNTHVGIGPAVGEDANIADEGRLFSIQHFPAGTRFRGWIALGANAADEALDKFGLQGKGVTLRVGRRRHSYGALNVWVAETPEFNNTQSPWTISHGTLEKRWQKFQKYLSCEKHLKVRIQELLPDNFEEFYIFSLSCLTDLILLDDFLRPCRAITASQVARWLDFDCSKDKQSVRRLNLRTGTRLIAGWNAAHRLPKENDAAIEKGSVFLFAIQKNDLEETALLEKLANLENGGVGWRRSEGFGQILVCDPFHLQSYDDKFDRKDVKLKPPCLEPKTTKAKEEPFAEFDEEVLDFLENNKKALHDKRQSLTKTQLNSLRERARRYELSDRLSREGEETQKAPQQRLETFLKGLDRKSKTEGWKVEVKINEERKKLTQALIVLFKLTDGASWEETRRRVNDFVRGMLLITSSEKPPKLKAQFPKGEEEKGNE